MSTLKQQDANRANAQHSTGPRTDAGKAISAKNALTHGLSAQTADQFPPAVRQAYLDLRAQLFVEYAPANHAEATLLEDYILSSFQHQRAQLLLTQSLERHIADPDDEKLAKRLATHRRYASAFARQAAWAFAKLRELQANRIVVRHEAYLVDGEIPDTVPYLKIHSKADITGMMAIRRLNT